MTVYSRITDLGFTTMLAAQNTGLKVDITYFKIGARASFVPTGLETSVDTPVYTGSPSQLRRLVLDNQHILYQIDLDESVGPFDVGNIGLYTSDNKLFSLTVYPDASPKLVGNGTPASVGMHMRRTIMVVLGNATGVINVDTETADYGIVPKVATEASLPAVGAATYPLYLVAQNTKYNNAPTFAYQDLVSNAWLYHVIETTGEGNSGYVSMSGNTSNNSQTELFLSGGGRMTLPNRSTWYFDIQVIGHRTDAFDRGIWNMKGAIKRDANAASTALQGILESSWAHKSDAAWDVTVDADTVNGSLRIRVTGATGKTVKWLARINRMEVTN